jgi:hypothetical protein
MLNFDERYRLTLTYLENLKLITVFGWKEHLNNLDNFSEEEYVIHKISLINPSNYKLIDKTREHEFDKIQERIQGPRIFKRFPELKKCESNGIWGYCCPLESKNIVYDHDFPYSLGGPTNYAYNRRILCKWHNMVKSNDIHNFDWNALFDEYKYNKSILRPHWIDEQLKKIIFEFNL